MAPNSPIKARAGGLGKRVAVIVDSIDVKYQAELVRHIRIAGEQRKIQVLVFPGGILGSDHKGARQRNRVYDLIDSACVDGVILLSPTISAHIGHAGLVEFCQQFKGLPLCSIGDLIEGVPSILVNNERGVRDMVRHLAVEHGYRRFAFIHGNLENVEDEIRYRAYCSELETLGVDVDPSLAPTGDFLLESGRAAMQGLLSRDNTTIDAVLACNDYMALGALEAIFQHRPQLMRHPAVVGFDNIDESNVSLPPLTTVEQPLAQMAETAIRSILAQIQGSETSTFYCLEPWLVLRRSCGCSNVSHRQPETILLPSRSHSGLLEGRFAGRREYIMAEMARAARGQLRAVANWESSLLTALVDELRGIPGNKFAATISQLLSGMSSREGELWRVNDVLATLRLQTLQLLGETAPERNQAEELFQMGRSLVSEAVVRSQALTRLTIERLLRGINETAISLGECTDTAQLRQKLAIEIPKLGTKQLILASFRATSSEDNRRYASLFFALRIPARALLQDSEPYPANNLIPERLWAIERECSFVVLPLFFGHEFFGIAMIDFEIDHGAVYEALRLHLSASLWKALLTSTDVSGSIAPATVRQVMHAT